VAFHISNRYVDLRPVLAGVADAVGAFGAATSYVPDEAARADGAARSEVAVLSTDRAAIDALIADGTGWEPLASDRAVVWTDDHANLLSVLRR
jgi:hypothetical protein